MKIERVITNVEYAGIKSKIAAEYDYILIFNDEIITDPMCRKTVYSNSVQGIRETIKRTLNTAFSGVVVRTQTNEYYNEEYCLNCDGLLEDMLYVLKGYDGIEAYAFMNGEFIGHLEFDPITKDLFLETNLTSCYF